MGGGLTLGGECGRRGGVVIGELVGAGECRAGSGEDVESKVAAAFDPFVVLFS